MANFKVPDFFNGTSNANNIYGTRVFSTNDWQQFGNDVNHLIGRGNRLLNFVDCTGTQGTPSITSKCQFALSKGEHIWKRMWIFDIYSDGAGNDNLQLNVTCSGFVNTYYINSKEVLSGGYAILYQDVPTAESNIGVNGVVTGSIQLLKTSTSTFYLNAVSCYEIPRNILNPITYSFDYGVDLDSFRYRAGLFDSGLSTTYSSIKGLARNVLKAEHRSRRACLFGFTSTYENNLASPTTFGRFRMTQNSQNLSLFGSSVPPKFLARKRYENETSQSLRVFALCASSGSVTGSLFITGSDGAISTLTIASSTPRWLTTTFSWYCDNYDYANTFPNETIPVFNCSVSRSNSVGSTHALEVFSFFVMETDSTFSSSF